MGRKVNASYMRPTTSSAMKASITYEENRQKGRQSCNEKPRRPESVNIDTNIDSKLQDDDDKPFSSLPERPLSPIDTSANSKKKSSEVVLIDNLLFYQGKIKSKPAPGYYITDMLKWKGDYDQLERNHLYIQWLFPIHESKGLNRAAQALTDFEGKAIQEDENAHIRVLKAYNMMLDFYGMVLVNERDGTVGRSEENYVERYDNINRYRHNQLRITRIIKSMGELGYQKFQAPLVNFLYEECIVHRTLANFRQSCFDHWINAIYDDNERAKMYRRFHGFPAEIGDSFTFGAEDGHNETAKKDDFVQGSENGLVNPLTENSGSHDLYGSGLCDKTDDIRKMESISDHQNGESFSDHKQDKLNSDNKKMEEIKTQEFHIDINDDSASTHTDKKSQTKVHDHGARQEDMESPTLHARPISAYSDDERKDINKELSCVESSDHSLDEPRAAASRTEDMDIGDTKQCDNLRFYRNEILSRPPLGYTIDTILKHHGDYKFFDEYPYFIKWLFPTPSSQDINTQELLPFEAKAITDDRVTFGRVKQAYVLVLDYYGIKMVDARTGELKKSKHWKSRWKQLNLNFHPELRRITRVLASLGELGCKKYQVPLIEIFIKNKKDIEEFEWISVLYWIDTVKNDGEREQLFEKHGKQVFSDKTLNSFSRDTVNVYKYDDYEHDRTLGHLDTVGPFLHG
ncbi:hypothetical protein ACF0H5_015920 [Mactra antiquata]